VQSTSGAVVMTAVNYGHIGSSAYKTVCLADLAGITDVSVIDGDYTSTFSDQYPTNLCDKTNGVYKPSLAGNIGIAAGGYNPESAYAFSGGKVTAGANSKIFGMLLAGGYLDSASGQVSVYGAMEAAVQGTKGVEDNDLGASLTVDLTKGGANYNALLAPDMTTGGCPTSVCAGLGYQAPKARILWSKYL
jgi:hypothetical protein